MVDPGKTPLLRWRHTKARLDFAKMYVDKPLPFWENYVVFSCWLSPVSTMSLICNNKVYYLGRPGEGNRTGNTTDIRVYPSPFWL